MITDSQFAAWLEDSSALHVTLFEVGVKSGGVDVIRYLSNRDYIASANTPYQAVVAVGLQMTEAISMDSEASLSAADIEIHNGDGALDAWLDDIWANQPINVFVGDVRWARADFRQVFSGTIIDIGCKARDRLNLRLSNKLERLNTPITDTKIGGNATNPDTLAPVLLGECHNISPVLTDPVKLEFAFNDGVSEAVAEVRTDGKPRGAVTVTQATGKLVFNEAVGPGAVTCCAQGVKYNGSYVNTITQLVQYLVTQRGKATTRFTAADLDGSQLAAFDAANPQPVGLYLTDRTNVLVACQQLASSVGAQVVVSMTGKLRLIQFAIPAAATTEIRPSQQLERSITIVKRTEVSAAVKIGYCRNWTVQANLQTSLPEAHKNLYAQQWSTVTSLDAAVQALYKLDAEPKQIDTCLLRKSDAQAEGDRRLAILKVPRTTYRFEGTPSLLLIELGQAVKLFSGRFGLVNGKFGQVTSRAANWDTLRTILEVTV